MFKRKVKYSPTEQERENNLRLYYSIAEGKVVRRYRSRFVRVCDYPYDEFNGLKIKEHYLLLPTTPNIIIGNSMLEIEEERANNGYHIHRNPKHKQSVGGIYHKHILKVEDKQQNRATKLLNTALKSLKLR